MVEGDIYHEYLTGATVSKEKIAKRVMEETGITEGLNRCFIRS